MRPHTPPEPFAAAIARLHAAMSKVANGDIAHSSVIYLIDRAGYERVGFADLPAPASVEGDIRILAGT